MKSVTLIFNEEVLNLSVSHSKKIGTVGSDNWNSISRSEFPELSQLFQQIVEKNNGKGRVSQAVKRLCAVAIAIQLRSDALIVITIKRAIVSGASRDQVKEAIGIALMMNGGPVFEYGVRALKAFDTFNHKGDKSNG